MRAPLSVRPGMVLPSVSLTIENLSASTGNAIPPLLQVSVRIVQIAGEETGFADKVGFIDQCACALGSFCIV